MIIFSINTVISLQITQNSLQGLFIDKPNIIHGYILLKKDLDEYEAQITFHAAINTAISYNNPKAKCNVTYVYIGHFAV